MADGEHSSQALPLLRLLLQLRDVDFLLGLDDYVALQRLTEWYLQSDDAQGDPASYFRMLCLLLAKDQTDAAMLKRKFDDFIVPYLLKTHDADVVLDVPPPLVPPPPPEDALSDSQIIEPTSGAVSEERAALPAVLPPPTVEIMDGDPLTKAVTAPLQDNTLLANKLRLRTDYFPVTVRQMQQSWRHIRRPIRTGPKVDLDVEATVQQIGREGMLSAPVLMPRRLNRAEIMLLIDCEGSMVPFHLLTRQISETALRGGGLYTTHMYYFHDHIDRYVYLDRARVKARRLDDLLLNHDSRCSILILSDAGAARGKLEERREKITVEFIKRLKATKAYVAWLNPMPASRWHQTTAAKIAQFVPMFQMNREGLDAAIRVLRGHTQAESEVRP